MLLHQSNQDTIQIPGPGIAGTGRRDETMGGGEDPIRSGAPDKNDKTEQEKIQEHQENEDLPMIERSLTQESMVEQSQSMVPMDKDSSINLKKKKKKRNLTTTSELTTREKNQKENTEKNNTQIIIQIII